MPLAVCVAVVALLAAAAPAVGLEEQQQQSLQQKRQWSQDQAAVHASASPGSFAQDLHTSSCTVTMTVRPAVSTRNRPTLPPRPLYILGSMLCQADVLSNGAWCRFAAVGTALLCCFCLRAR